MQDFLVGGHIYRARHFQHPLQVFGAYQSVVTGNRNSAFVIDGADVPSGDTDAG